MTETQLATRPKADAPAEWGTRAEVGALADRLATMLPNAKELSREEVLTAAQYCRMMDLNPFRGEVYFYKSRGRLCVVDGYKALARWANDKQPYSDRYDEMETMNGQLVAYRCWILRDDRKASIKDYMEMGATFQEAFQIAATYADGVVNESEAKGREPPTGWTWEQVARKRALKNALNLSHGAPSPREIAAITWNVNGVQTIPEDWDGTEDLHGFEAEKLAELQAKDRTRRAEWEAMTHEQHQTMLQRNNELLHGDDDFEGFDDLESPPPEWDGDTWEAGEDDEAIDAARANVLQKASLDRAHRLFVAVNNETGGRFNALDHMRNAIRIELGNESWDWPKADDKDEWDKATSAAKAYAKKEKA